MAALEAANREFELLVDSVVEHGSSAPRVHDSLRVALDGERTGASAVAAAVAEAALPVDPVASALRAQVETGVADLQNRMMGASPSAAAVRDPRHTSSHRPRATPSTSQRVWKNSNGVTVQDSSTPLASVQGVPHGVVDAVAPGVRATGFPQAVHRTQDHRLAEGAAEALAQDVASGLREEWDPDEGHGFDGAGLLVSGVSSRPQGSVVQHAATTVPSTVMVPSGDEMLQKMALALEGGADAASVMASRSPQELLAAQEALKQLLPASILAALGGTSRSSAIGGGMAQQAAVGGAVLSDGKGPAQSSQSVPGAEDDATGVVQPPSTVNACCSLPHDKPLDRASLAKVHAKYLMDSMAYGRSMRAGDSERPNGDEFRVLFDLEGRIVLRSAHPPVGTDMWAVDDLCIVCRSSIPSQRMQAWSILWSIVHRSELCSSDGDIYGVGTDDEVRQDLPSSALPLLLSGRVHVLACAALSDRVAAVAKLALRFLHAVLCPDPLTDSMWSHSVLSLRGMAQGSEPLLRDLVAALTVSDSFIWPAAGSGGVIPMALDLGVDRGTSDANRAQDSFEADDPEDLAVSGVVPCLLDDLSLVSQLGIYVRQVLNVDDDGSDLAADCKMEYCRVFEIVARCVADDHTRGAMSLFRVGQPYTRFVQQLELILEQAITRSSTARMLDVACKVFSGEAAAGGTEVGLGIVDVCVCCSAIRLVSRWMQCSREVAAAVTGGAVVSTVMELLHVVYFPLLEELSSHSTKKAVDGGETRPYMMVMCLIRELSVMLSVMNSYGLSLCAPSTLSMVVLPAWEWMAGVIGDVGDWAAVPAFQTVVLLTMSPIAHSVHLHALCAMEVFEQEDNHNRPSLPLQCIPLVRSAALRMLATIVPCYVPWKGTDGSLGEWALPLWTAASSAVGASLSIVRSLVCSAPWVAHVFPARASDKGTKRKKSGRGRGRTLCSVPWNPWLDADDVIIPSESESPDQWGPVVEFIRSRVLAGIVIPLLGMCVPWEAFAGAKFAVPFATEGLRRTRVSESATCFRPVPLVSWLSTSCPTLGGPHDAGSGGLLQLLCAGAASRCLALCLDVIRGSFDFIQRRVAVPAAGEDALRWCLSTGDSGSVAAGVLITADRVRSLLCGDHPGMRIVLPSASAKCAHDAGGVDRMVSDSLLEPFWHLWCACLSVNSSAVAWSASVDDALLMMCLSRSGAAVGDIMCLRIIRTAMLADQGAGGKSGIPLQILKLAQLRLYQRERLSVSVAAARPFTPVQYMVSTLLGVPCKSSLFPSGIHGNRVGVVTGARFPDPILLLSDRQQRQVAVQEREGLEGLESVGSKLCRMGPWWAVAAPTAALRKLSASLVEGTVAGGTVKEDEGKAGTSSRDTRTQQLVAKCDALLGLLCTCLRSTTASLTHPVCASGHGPVTLTPYELGTLIIGIVEVGSMALPDTDFKLRNRIHSSIVELSARIVQGVQWDAGSSNMRPTVLACAAILESSSASGSTQSVAAYLGDALAAASIQWHGHPPCLPLLILFVSPASFTADGVLAATALRALVENARLVDCDAVGLTPEVVVHTMLACVASSTPVELWTELRGGWSEDVLRSVVLTFSRAVLRFGETASLDMKNLLGATLCAVVLGPYVFRTMGADELSTADCSHLSLAVQSRVLGPVETTVHGQSLLLLLIKMSRELYMHRFTQV